MNCLILLVLLSCSNSFGFSGGRCTRCAAEESSNRRCNDRRNDSARCREERTAERDCGCRVERTAERDCNCRADGRHESRFEPRTFGSFSGGNCGCEENRSSNDCGCNG